MEIGRISSLILWRNENSLIRLVGFGSGHLSADVGQAKRHHYLPVCYLTGFLGPEERLAIFDRSQNEYRSQSPQNAGFEKYLYSFIEADGTRGQTLEETFCRFEGHFPKIRQRLEAGDLLNQEELDPIFAFTAAQMFRGPRALEDMTEIGSLAIDDSLEKALADETTAQAFMKDTFGDDLGYHKLPLEEIKSIVADMEAQHHRKNSILRVLSEIMATAYIKLHDKAALTILHAPPGKAFLTCDRPVLIRKVSPNALGVEGLLGEGSGAFIPLSKRIGLSFEEGSPSLIHRNLTRNDLFGLNSSIAISSWRLLLSDSDQRLKAFVGKTKIAARAPFRCVSAGSSPSKGPRG